jgi:hypothetical protein
MHFSKWLPLLPAPSVVRYTIKAQAENNFLYSVSKLSNQHGYQIVVLHILPGSGKFEHLLWFHFNRLQFIFISP